MNKIMPTTWLLVAILLAVVLGLWLPILRWLPTPWNLLGFLPLAFGVLINLQADRAFHQAETTVKPLEPSSTLVTDGVFGWTRNPMYLGFVLILAGTALLLGALSPWLVVVAYGVFVDRAFIRVEERMLAEDFDTAWTAYTRRVRRWL